MNFRYFFYALFVTIVASAISWASMIGSSSSSGSGRSYGSHSGGSWGGGSSGGGHK